MSLALLQINNFRNITSLCLQPCSGFNVVVGANGSGKTSILEAIHLLGTGRSFRSRFNRRLIQYQQSQLQLFAEVHHPTRVKIPIGIEKTIQGSTKIRMAGETIQSSALLAELLPLQLLSCDSYELLTGGSKLRRELIDWGLFHVEHGFFVVWKNYQRSLEQRNAALRAEQPIKQIKSWDSALVQYGTMLTNWRKKYVSELWPIVIQLLQDLLPNTKIDCRFYCGWIEAQSLEQALHDKLLRDVRLGFTSAGAHRADLRLTCQNVPVVDALSRGQQKLLVYALKLAQSLLLPSHKTPIYLLDDVPAELDPKRRAAVYSVLLQLQAQVFLTGTEDAHFIDCLAIGPATKMFHVEHGALT